MNKFKVIVQQDAKRETHILRENELEEFAKSNTIIHLEPLGFNFKPHFRTKISQKEITLFFSQLSTILNANISFLEALEIIAKSNKSKSLNLLINDMKESLHSGQNIEHALEKHENSLDHTIIGFLKIAFLKGNLVNMVASLARLLELKEQNRTLIKSAVSYPIVVFITFLIALSVIFVYVVPKFEFVFIQYQMQLPFYTSSLLGVKTFFIKYAFLFLGFLFVALAYLRHLYKSRDTFAYKVDRFLLLKIPIFSSAYKTSQLYNFFMALNVLISSSYQFNEALENGQLLLKNKYLLDKIRIISKQIQSGMPIYDAFDSSQLVDEVTLNLINSGEKSSTMAFSFEKIETIYEQNFRKSIKRLSSFIEPLFFVSMMLLILWVMLAIFTPIWNMSGMINQ